METLKLVWPSLSFFCALYWLAYCFLWALAENNPRSKAIRKEMWWFMVYVAAPVSQIAWWSDITWVDWVFGPFNLFIWWMVWKNDDHDDRWKKRRKKALNKIKVVAGKLVVVPLPHSRPT